MYLDPSSFTFYCESMLDSVVFIVTFIPWTYRYEWMEELKRSIDGVHLSYLWQNLLHVLHAGTGTTFCSSLISVSLNSGAHCPLACHKSQHGPVLATGFVGFIVWGFFLVLCVCLRGDVEFSEFCLFFLLFVLISIVSDWCAIM